MGEWVSVWVALFSTIGYCSSAWKSPSKIPLVRDKNSHLGGLALEPGVEVLGLPRILLLDQVWCFLKRTSWKPLGRNSSKAHLLCSEPGVTQWEAGEVIWGQGPSSSKHFVSFTTSGWKGSVWVLENLSVLHMWLSLIIQWPSTKPVLPPALAWRTGGVIIQPCDGRV